MPSTLSAGEALVKLLSGYGVELVFGIPGTHSIELYRGLGSGSIRHISPRHEQGGGFMADGYARTSGNPGVCFVITGPGVTNIATPMGEAYMDSVPMLVISPVNDPDPDDVNRGRLHEITNQSAVTRPLTAESIQISAPEDIPVAVARAFEVFASERPRPVHINIPLSIIPQQVEDDWKPALVSPLPVPSDSQLEAFRKVVEQASNPVIIAGGGARFGSESVLNLAEKIGCPVVTTVAGRGIVPANHPLGIGAQLRTPHAQQVLAQADLGIFLGTELAQTDHWNDDLVLPRAQCWVNLCPHVLELRREHLVIQADCIAFSARASELLDNPDPDAVVSKHEWCAELRNHHSDSMTPKERIHWKVLTRLIKHLPDNATIVSDMTQIAYTAVDYLPMNRPGQWHHPTGYGTLGYALPAAIGTVLADQNNPALVIVGDAGLQYTVQEMSLAAELSLNIVVLLWNNDALQQICEDMDNAGINRVGIFQQNPDFITLSEAFGWTSVQLSGLDDLGPELDLAFDTPGPVLLKLDERSVSD